MRVDSHTDSENIGNDQICHLQFERHKKMSFTLIQKIWQLVFFMFSYTLKCLLCNLIIKNH